MSTLIVSKRKHLTMKKFLLRTMPVQTSYWHVATTRVWPSFRLYTQHWMAMKSSEKVKSSSTPTEGRIL